FLNYFFRLLNSNERRQSERAAKGHSTMGQFEARSMIDAANGPAAARTAPHRLAEAAAMAAAEPVVPAISPIVLAGAVRMIEISLVALIGMLIYVGYVVPQDGLEWHYFAAIAGVSVLVL